MSLTLEAEQRLERVGLVGFFNRSRNTWNNLAQETYTFVDESFPNGSTVRPDDAAKVLIPLLEVNENLAEFLAENKLKQKYWIKDFVDLILDRTWDDLD